MSEAIRLRTMARKSVFSFGKHEGLSVQQVLDLKDYSWLRWCYFNCSMLSFLPDILDEVRILDDFRIEKPGTDAEKYEAYKKYMEVGFALKLKKSGKTEGCSIYNKVYKRRRTAARNRMLSVMHADKAYFSKASMQRRNHGH